MYPEGPLMIGAAADRLTVIWPIPDEYHHRPAVAVYGEIEIQFMLPFQLILIIKHPEIVRFDIDAYPPETDNPISQVRVQREIVIVIFLPVYSPRSIEACQYVVVELIFP